jgi:hypothetical protein
VGFAGLVLLLYSAPDLSKKILDQLRESVPGFNYVFPSRAAENEAFTKAMCERVRGGQDKNDVVQQQLTITELGGLTVVNLDPVSAKKYSFDLDGGVPVPVGVVIAKEAPLLSPLLRAEPGLRVGTLIWGGEFDMKQPSMFEGVCSVFNLQERIDGLKRDGGTSVRLQLQQPGQGRPHYDAVTLPLRR